MQRLLKRSLWCVLALPVACSAEQPPEHEPPNAKPTKVTECQIPSDAFTNLPQQVLAGTDLKPLDSFVSSEQTTQLKARYTMEMGGAVILLNQTVGDSAIGFSREYREPGMPADVKGYEKLCFNNNRLYGEHMRALLVESGLLWLELNSGNDFIPNDFWLLLE